MQGVKQTDKGWKAIADVIVTPKPAPKAKLKLKPKPKPKPELKLVQAKEPAFEYIPQIANEQEKTKQREMSIERQNRIDEEQVARRERELCMRRDIAEEDAEITYLYMEISYEDLFMNIEPQYDFSYVHYVASGSLWDAVQKYHPDLEMYEAAHNIEAMKQDSPSPKLLRLLKRTKADPENYPDLLNELVKN